MTQLPSQLICIRGAGSAVLELMVLAPAIFTGEILKSLNITHCWETNGCRLGDSWTKESRAELSHR